MTLDCFKAYDIRGRVGSELSEDIAYRIGRALARHLDAKKIVVGADIRTSSAPLKAALADGLRDAGCDVVDLGMTGTEEVYFATQHLDADGGVEVTASHNPLEYNGMKLVARGARPISNDTGLLEIRAMVEASLADGSSAGGAGATVRGSISHESILEPFADYLLTFVDASALRPLKLVVNAGNGAAGHVIDAIERRFRRLQVPVQFIKIFHEPDGTFPNGIPNPLLPENRSVTADAVRTHGADIGIAWDGDFDRCFFFDERGEFVEGYYVVGLLATAFLAKHPGEKIIHDPRLTWNTIESVVRAGGIPVQSKTGHAFIKQRMRDENAIYGGEMSAHHYFRDFTYCDSGMIPWLLVIELMSRSGLPLSRLVGERIAAYPCSGEINFRVADVQQSIARILQHYLPQQPKLDHTDGISLEFDAWRFNLRGSNTEPLLRLNVETRGDAALLQRRTEELSALIRALGAGR